MLPAVGRRRIVILTEDSKPALGGIAEYLHQLALATAVTHDVVVVSSVAGAEAQNAGLPFRYREERWFRSQWRYLGDQFAALRRLNTLRWRSGRHHRVCRILAAINAERPDTIYVIGRLSPVTYPWCAACEELGLPYSVIGYGLELIEPVSARHARHRGRAIRDAAHWFPISLDTRGTLERLGVPADRMTVLRPGVGAIGDDPPDAAERQRVRGRLGIGGRPYVFSLCHLRRRKGIDLAIAAFAGVASDFPDLMYVVGGTGPEQPALVAQAAASGLADRVVFAGAVDEPTKAVLFAECEFFVMPNRVDTHDVEGFGIVFLEAGQHGKAVIGGANGGVPEAVNDGSTGLLVDTTDVPPLMSAMRRLLRHPEEASRLGENGRQRAAADFAWSDRAQTFVEQAGAAARRARRRVSRTMAHSTANHGSPLRSRVRAGVRVAVSLTRRRRLVAYVRPGDADHDAGPLGEHDGERIGRRARTREMLAWLERAFDAAGGGAAAAGYHIVTGWAAPYPEITGYTIRTLVGAADRWAMPALAVRASLAGEWLARTRLPGGAICRKQWHPANTIPSVFNTAQVLEGWCALARREPADGRWVEWARQSARWLMTEQEQDGSWVRAAFNGIPHSYYARVAGPLADFAELTQDAGAADAARRCCEWVLSQQQADGWVHRAGFALSDAPTTHTIGYVLEGLLQVAERLGEPRFAEAAERGARPLLELYGRTGRIPGRLGRGWASRAHWRCLTGDAQVALVWARLGRYTGDPAWRGAAIRLAADVLDTVRIIPSWPEISGAIQGSRPAWGDYDPYGYPTHAVKFMLDLLDELDELDGVREAGGLSGVAKVSAAATPGRLAQRC
jgi:glycosyltransferase involved in cell wall biosynthesis